MKLIVLIIALLLQRNSFAKFEEQCNLSESNKLSIYYHNKQPLPLVKGKIDGKDVVMLLDSGSSWTSFSPTIVKILPLRIVPIDRKVDGFGGKSKVSITKVKSFEFGKSKFSDHYFFVINDWGFQPYFEVILSSDFLLKKVVEIDIKKSSLTFYNGSLCEHKGPQGEHNFFQVKLLPQTEDDVRPKFIVTLNQIEFTAIIDTAATVSVLKQNVAQRIGIQLNFKSNPDIRSTVGVGGQSNVLPASVNSMKIGNTEINHHNFVVSESTEDNDKLSEVILGLDFLKKYTVVLDAPSRRMLLK